MPSVTDSNAVVLVTGSTGFLGVWIVEALLRRGYSVRASVRTEAKGRHLLEVFISYGDKVHLCLVDDIATVDLLVWSVWCYSLT